MWRTMGLPFRRDTVDSPFLTCEGRDGSGGAGDAERGVVEGTGVLGGMGVLVGSAMAAGR